MDPKYIPKQFLQLFKQEEMDGNKIIWKQVDTLNLSVSFCCYYEGGQWRHITSCVDLSSMYYTFSSVFYPNGSNVGEGSEITKSEWREKGYSIKNDGKSMSEIIPIHDPEALNWFAAKNIVEKVGHEEYKGAGLKIARFLNTIGMYKKMSKESETYENQLNKIIENLGVMKNVAMVKEMLDKAKDYDEHNLQNLYSVFSIKKSRQINHEHIYQITKPFFGEFNVSSK